MTLYAGIGSRETPPSSLRYITTLAEYLAQHQYTLRSGSAAGADRAFEAGAALGAGHISSYTPTTLLDWPALMDHASHFHPNWPAVTRMGDFVMKLHARNSAIILGPTLDTPVHFVLFWTQKGAITGGTGQGLRIARHHNIPCYWTDDPQLHMNFLLPIPRKD